MYCAVFTRTRCSGTAAARTGTTIFRMCAAPCSAMTQQNPYGLIRDLRDPQSDLNHRRNKALFLASTRRVVMDEGAVKTSSCWRPRWRPDAIIEKQRGAAFEVIKT